MGLSYAGLLIVTLDYASANAAKTGVRIGISRSVEQIGPLLVMSLGTWAVAITGPQDIFIYIGMLSTSALLLAWCSARKMRRPSRLPEQHYGNLSGIPRPQSC